MLQAASKSEHNAWLSQLIQGTLYASKNLGTLHVPCRSVCDHDGEAFRF